jgi:hypothetical protein
MGEQILLEFSAVSDGLEKLPVGSHTSDNRLATLGAAGRFPMLLGLEPFCSPLEAMPFAEPVRKAFMALKFENGIYRTSQKCLDHILEIGLLQWRKGLSRVPFNRLKDHFS